MDLKNYLTNEKVRKKFVSQFDLVNYAIKLAANMIQTGRDSRVKVDSQNRSMHILSEILNDKDHFDEIIVREKDHLEAPIRHQEREEIQDESKAKVRKKPRKILADN